MSVTASCGHKTSKNKKKKSKKSIRTPSAASTIVVQPKSFPEARPVSSLYYTEPPTTPFDSAFDDQNKHHSTSIDDLFQSSSAFFTDCSSESFVPDSGSGGASEIQQQYISANGYITPVLNTSDNVHQHPHEPHYYLQHAPPDRQVYYPVVPSAVVFGHDQQLLSSFNSKQQMSLSLNHQHPLMLEDATLGDPTLPKSQPSLASLPLADDVSECRDQAGSSEQAPSLPFLKSVICLQPPFKLDFVKSLASIRVKANQRLGKQLVPRCSQIKNPWTILVKAAHYLCNAPSCFPPVLKQPAVVMSGSEPDPTSNVDSADSTSVTHSGDDVEQPIVTDTAMINEDSNDKKNINANVNDEKDEPQQTSSSPLHPGDGKTQDPDDETNL